VPAAGRSPPAVTTEPSVQPDGRGQQGCAVSHGFGEDPFGLPDFALLVEVRCGEPLMQVERVAGGGEDGAAVG
jgi:hypothetical protein